VSAKKKKEGKPGNLVLYHYRRKSDNFIGSSCHFISNFLYFLISINQLLLASCQGRYIPFETETFGKVYPYI